MNTSYGNVRFWQTMELVWVLSEGNSRLSDEELYGLTGQVRRAAVSIPRNIGEGEGHPDDKEWNTSFVRTVVPSERRRGGWAEN